MRKLVVLVLALLLSGAACGPPLNERHLMGNGNPAHGGTTGDTRSSLRLEKMSDAALGTHAAIENAANNRGTIQNAAQLGFKMASAAATPSVSHTAQMELEGGRRLMGNGNPAHGGTFGGTRTSLRLEKMSDAALGTHAAIENAANNRGKIANAAQLGFKMASAAATPSVSHQTQMELEGGRRLTGTTTYRDDVGSLDTAMAVSAAINKAVKTPSMGSAAYATTTGTRAGHVAAGAHPHTMLQTDQAVGGRRLTDTYRNDVGAMDANMAASAAIAKAVKTPSMGGAKYATDAGITTGRVASRSHTGWQVDQAVGGRRLTDTYRNDVGAMDANMAASAAIAKAVKTPSMGGAKYATDAGVATGRIASRSHTGWDVDRAAGGRRLVGDRDRSGAGSLDVELAASDAISKAVTTPSKGSAKYATEVGIKTGRLSASAHSGWDTDRASGGRRLYSNRDRSGVGALDATLAASDAINKAVKTPSMGSAKFATQAGLRTGRVGATAHTGWDVDNASGGRRMLSNRDRSGVGSLDATLAAADAISKAVKTPSMGSAKFATQAGLRTQRVGAMAHSGFETDMAGGGRRLLGMLRV